MYNVMYQMYVVTHYTCIVTKCNNKCRKYLNSPSFGGQLLWNELGENANKSVDMTTFANCLGTKCICYENLF